MRILIVSPAPPGSRIGNRVTSLRMAGLLRQAGHEVKLRQEWQECGAELLIALHAMKSAATVAAARAAHPGLPIVLVLTGTDLYHDIDREPAARRSLDLSDRLVILQPKAIERLPQSVHAKTRLVLQSARAPRQVQAPDPEHFDVCVLAHLRAVKDPLLAARAARRLPANSRVRVVLVGGALDEPSRLLALAEVAENPRLEWLGDLGHGRALGVLARSRLLVLTSRSEGGPAAVTEAIACGLPVLSTRIPASEGLLGEDHPGLFPIGDEAALAALLTRCEGDASFLEELRARSLRLAESVDPCREQRDLCALVAELSHSR